MLVILLVIRKASENLIPVSLEPGGKNPCVVVTDAITATGLRHAVGGGAVGI
jgi:acyl-CoA reductase-like NAD-dependent aldehyde dehydrogenase